MIGKLEQVAVFEDKCTKDITYSYREHEISTRIDKDDDEVRVDVQGPLVETWSGEGPHWKGFRTLEDAVMTIDNKFEAVSELIEKDRRHREGDEVLEDGSRVWRGV